MGCLQLDTLLLLFHFLIYHPTYGQTLYQQSQDPPYIGYLPHNTVRVPLHTYQHGPAGASNWQQPIQPVIPHGGIQKQPLQPTSHRMAPVNQTGQYGIQQPNVIQRQPLQLTSHMMAPVNQARQYGIQQPNFIQDVDTQMNNPQIRQPSTAHRETPKGNVSESHRARVNDQIVRGPVHVRDLESSWAKPPVKIIEER